MKKITWKYTGPVVTEKDIDDVERELAVRLPNDYIKCVRHNNGARPFPNVLDLQDRPQAIFHELLLFGGNKKNSIVSVRKAMVSIIGPRNIPFATDPFGNLFCFSYATLNKSSIVFWDHEKNSIQKICKTFTDLLSMLYTPE